MCWFAALGAAMGSGAASATAVGAATTLAIGGAGLAAYGQIRQANAASEIANYNAKVQENKALEATKAGVLAEDAHRAKVRQFIGAQAVEQGASGGVIGSGSGGMLMDEAAKFGEMDALTIRTNAMKQAWGFEQDALSGRLEGRVRRQQGYWSAGSTLLTGANQAFGLWASQK